MIIIILLSLCCKQETLKHYCPKQRGPYMPVEFKNVEIRLDIPNKGILLEKGWKLSPLIIPPVVSTLIKRNQF